MMEIEVTIGYGIYMNSHSHFKLVAVLPTLKMHSFS